MVIKQKNMFYSQNLKIFEMFSKRAAAFMNQNNFNRTLNFPNVCRNIIFLYNVHIADTFCDMKIKY